MKVRRKIEEMMRSKCKEWGYEEVKTPTFESLELFTMKSGEEIVDEIYGFKDKSNRELALRPEITASVMRYYSNELKAFPKPLKLFYFGNCFRYEQPQRGRFREFWQFGTEVIGGETKIVEAELIALVDELFSELGIEYELEIGNLGILRSLMNHYDLSTKEQNKLFSEMDKENDLSSLSEEKNVPRELIKKIKKLRETKEPLNEVINVFDQINISKEPINAFMETLDLLEDYGISDYSINFNIVRGLDYYMGTVFEVFAEGLGAQNQICGGGTYKFPELIKENIASSGFAVGFDRVIEALKEQELISEIKPRSLIYVAPLSHEFQNESIKITKELRKHFSTEIDLKGRNIGDQLSYANRLNIPFVVLIGEEEIQENKISLKNMETGKQRKISIEEAIEEINTYKKKKTK